MDTTTATSTDDRHDLDGTKGYWVRRTVAPVGIAAGLALALALSACDTDTAVKRTSADAPTTTSVVEGDPDSPTSDLDSPSPTGGDAPTNPGGGQQGGQTGGQPGGQSGGQSGDQPGGPSNGDGSTSNGGNSQPDPTIDSFSSPETIDCHNSNFQEFTVSWETSNATKATISIDGPGVYAEYGPDDEASLPFTCTPGETQTILLTAYGHNGRTATHTVTLGGRNIQGEDPGNPAALTTAKVSGGATGTGPANDADCERVAANLNTLQDRGVREMASGNDAGASEAFDLADQLEDNAMDNGCFFVYT